MSWVNCDLCGSRHRIGACPRGAQRVPARPAADPLGEAARNLIDRANDAARARVLHGKITAPGSSANNDARYVASQNRRNADTEVSEALESYIAAVVKRYQDQ